MLWEFAIPTISTIRLRCLLQAASRSVRSQQILPSLLKTDLLSPVSRKTPKFCQPLSQEIKGILNSLRPAETYVLPLDKKRIDSVCDVAMLREWRLLSNSKARMVKPVLERPRYLSTDSKPTVCIRARLRLGVALTPKRRFIYGKALSDKCECGQVGDTDHILLRCRRFDRDRSTCVVKLQALCPPVVLTREVIFGLPPPIPSDFVANSYTRKQLTLRHEKCLFYTGKFITAIDNRFKL